MLVAGTVAPSLMRRNFLLSLVKQGSSVMLELFCLVLGPDDAVVEVPDVASSLLRSAPRFSASERFLLSSALSSSVRSVFPFLLVVESLTPEGDAFHFAAAVILLSGLEELI